MLAPILLTTVTIAVTVACGLLVRACLALLTTERAAFATERADLLQRIQAPEQAVMTHAIQQVDQAPAPPMALDDDRAQWEAMGIPKEQLADELFGAGTPA